MGNQTIIQYIIGFLLGDTQRKKCSTPTPLSSQMRIGYTNDPEEMKQYAVVICPSHFFDPEVYGTPKAEPTLPLNQWRGIPILFGTADEEYINQGQTLVIHADLIASTYYLISRYEEMTHRSVRDKHGRFPGKESLPYRAGFIHRPIVDEYGIQLSALIRQLTNNQEELTSCSKPYFGKVNLTHDIDRPYQYRGIRSFARAILKEGKMPWQAFKLAFGPVREDLHFTFPKFLDWNNNLRKSCRQGLVDTFFFLKLPSTHTLDAPYYHPRGGYIRPVLALARKHQVKLGLHCSYASGIKPEFLYTEVERFRAGYNLSAQYARHHFLSLREPEDTLTLYTAGVKHDYTMGYADVAGFRLGTSRPVKYINPNTRLLSELILHPLTMMDVTLSRSDYMGLSEEEATDYAMELVRRVAQCHGELNLLWHNDSMSHKIHPWLARLYRSLLHLIADIESAKTEIVETERPTEFNQVVQEYGATEIEL